MPKLMLECSGMLSIWNFSSLFQNHTSASAAAASRGRNVRELWLSQQAEAKHHSTLCYPQHLAPARMSPLAFLILVSVGRARL